MSLTDAEQSILRDIRNRGYAVVVYSPSFFAGKISRNDLEDTMMKAADTALRNSPPMKTYEVEVLRTGHASRIIKVVAENEQLAKEAALDDASAYEFSEYSSDYEVESVIEVNAKL